MTHIETARVNEAVGIQIGVVQEAARKLTAESAIEALEADISSLERTIADLRGVLESLPHRHA